MTAKEIIIIVALVVGVIGLTALYFRAIIIGWLAGGGGSGGAGSGPDFGPSGGTDGRVGSHSDHSHTDDCSCSDGGGSGD